jgi:hypothetical protein
MKLKANFLGLWGWYIINITVTILDIIQNNIQNCDSYRKDILLYSFYLWRLS